MGLNIYNSGPLFLLILASILVLDRHKDDYILLKTFSSNKLNVRDLIVGLSILL